MTAAPLRRRVGLIGLAAIVLALAGLAYALGSRPELKPVGARPELALFTSLPIVMGETAEIRDLLADPPPPHWAKAVLEERARLVPVDALTGPLPARLMVVAQPRPLAPEENVALDEWVRGGGRLLLFADPLSTWESVFPVGDKRRPQDVALLSPILSRWGLELRYDEDQASGERVVAELPVNLPGSLATRPGGFEADCTLGDGGLVANCRIGKGRAIIVADVAVLEPAEDTAERRKALETLLDRMSAE